MRERIQNALVDLARKGTFMPVQYDGDGRTVESGGVIGPVAPVAVNANETGSDFAIDDHDGRGLSMKRAGWQFELRVKFNREVSVEQFEQSLMDKPPVLTRTAYSRQATILLTKTSVIHPVLQQSLKGTEATFAFDVLIS